MNPQVLHVRADMDGDALGVDPRPEARYRRFGADMAGADIVAQLALGTIFFIVGVGLIRVVAFLRGDRD